MTLLQGLHGTIAMVLLCAVLFIDELGIPVPIAPNEAVLIIAGVLIANGDLAAWLFFPIAALVMTAGMVCGYSWARAVGNAGLSRIARRVRLEGAYLRVRERVRSAGPLGIGVARILPGVRPHATLVAGAAEVRITTFLLGAVPAIIVWLVVWTLVGILVGIPAEHLFSRFERLLLRGVLLIGLGVAVYLGVKRVPAARREPLLKVPRYVLRLLAVAIDSGVVASIAAGLTLITRWLFHVRLHAWVDIAVVVGMLLLTYVIGTARGSTMGEGLLGVRYPRLGDLGKARPAP